MTVLVRLGAVESRRFGFELVKPSSVVVTGGGSESATVSALGSVAFSAAATLSLNGVFSSGYDNYMVVCRVKSTTANSPGFRARLRSASTDASGTDYTVQYVYASSTSVSGLRSTSQTSAEVGGVGSGESGNTIYIYGPNLSQPTAFRSVTIYTPANPTIYDEASTHSLSTAYDGITLFVGSDAMTGRVAVYGMRG